MTTTGFPISFAPLAADADAPALRLTLEPEQAAGTNRASFHDIETMLSRARSGLSARTVQRERCSCVSTGKDGVLRLSLAALIWPSRPNLAYTFYAPSNATATRPEPYRRTRQWKFWTGGQTRLSLRWMLENASCVWQPGFACVDEFCSPMPSPTVRHEYAEIYLGKGTESKSAYGVLVVTGTAVGFRHPFTVEFAKFDRQGRAQKISLDSLPVSATWRDERGETQTEDVDIPIPACAKDLLESCDDGRGANSFHVNDHTEGHWEIAYNTCDGSVLGSRFVK